MLYILNIVETNLHVPYTGVNRKTAFIDHAHCPIRTVDYKLSVNTDCGNW